MELKERLRVRDIALRGSRHGDAQDDPWDIGENQAMMNFSTQGRQGVGSKGRDD